MENSESHSAAAPDGDPRKAYVDYANMGGIAFQAAVVRKLRELGAEGKTRWSVEATELPVEVRGRPFHVDILLKHADRERYLVVECKRAQPRFSTWAFAPATKETAGDSALVETIQGGPYLACRSFGVKDYTLRWCPQAMNGVELKTRSEKGDECAIDKSGRGAIQHAIDQSLRGVNGLVNKLAPIIQHRRYDSSPRAIPLVVTTARLWLVSVDLASANLHDGNLLYGSELSTEASFLGLRQHQSHDLKHDWGLERNPESSVTSTWITNLCQFPGMILSQAVDEEFVRTVLICQSESLEDFLSRLE